jgi:ribosomal protein L20
MHRLKVSDVGLDRKMLADLAATDPKRFHDLVTTVSGVQE